MNSFKKLGCLSFFLLVGATGFSQKTAQTPAPAPKSTVNSSDSAFWAKEYLLNYAVYRNGLAYGDLLTAKHALYEMIAINPANKNLKDSLMLVYFRLEAFPQSILLSKEILADKPDDALVLEVKAISEQNLRLTKEALETYEKLFAKSKDLYHLYQIGVLQYQLKRFGESTLSLSQLIKAEGVDKKEIVITNANGQSQKVSMKAGAFNILGVQSLETNALQEAKAYFQEALKIAPDFDLAKGNLKVVEDKLKPKTPAAPKK